MVERKKRKTRRQIKRQKAGAWYNFFTRKKNTQVLSIIPTPKRVPINTIKRIEVKPVKELSYTEKVMTNSANPTIPVWTNRPNSIGANIMTNLAKTNKAFFNKIQKEKVEGQKPEEQKPTLNISKQQRKLSTYSGSIYPGRQQLSGTSSPINPYNSDFQEEPISFQEVTLPGQVFDGGKRKSKTRKSKTRKSKSKKRKSTYRR